MKFQTIMIAILSFLLIGFLISLISTKIFKHKYFGAFWGAALVATFGSILGSFAFDWIFIKLSELAYKILYLFNWLMRNTYDHILPPVNIIAAIAGGVLMVYLYHKIGPGKSK